MLVGHLDSLLVADNKWFTTTFCKGSTIQRNIVSYIYHAVCELIGTLDQSLNIRRLLMFASGIPSAEKPQAKRYYLKAHGPEPDKDHPDAWTEYKAYLNRTSILIPIPQVIYKRLPTFVKRTILFDFPMYQFNEHGEDGKRAREEVQSREEL